MATPHPSPCFDTLIHCSQTHTHTSCFVIKTSSCKSRAGSVLLLALNDPGSVSDSTSGHQIHLNVAQWGNGGHIMRRQNGKYGVHLSPLYVLGCVSAAGSTHCRGEVTGQLIVRKRRAGQTYMHRKVCNHAYFIHTLHIHKDTCSPCLLSDTSHTYRKVFELLFQYVLV